MKAILFVMFVFGSITGNAQAKNMKSNPKKKSMRESSGYTNTTNPGKIKNDTIKINTATDKNFNPSNSKISNSKIKTPLYDNTLTGTGAPGDQNTGIRATPAHRQTTSPSLEKVKAIQDSLKPNK